MAVVAGEIVPRGDVEAESLLPGDYVLIFYEDDSVWHERTLLWKFGRRWETVTPDDEQHFELLSPGKQGIKRIVRLDGDGHIPDRLRESVYRFDRYPTAAAHGQRLRDSFARAQAAEGDKVQLFSLVKDGHGDEVASDIVVGRAGLPRRLARKVPAALPPSSAPPAFPALPDRRPARRPEALPQKANPDSWRNVVGSVEGDDDDTIWVLAESVDAGRQVGDEVKLDKEKDFIIGNFNAMHNLGDGWARCERMLPENVPKFVEMVRQRYVVDAPAGQLTPRGLQVAELGQEDYKPEDDEVRTLSVDTDDQGERFKDWRTVVRESRSYSWGQVPVDLGPWTLLDLMKSMGRNGGDAQSWLVNWAHKKGIQETDRVMHELRCLIDTLYYAATYDQLNCPALLSFEILNRRICSLVEAHRNPGNPNWSASKFYELTKSPEDIVPENLRAHVNRKEKEYRELMDGRRRLTAGGAAGSYEVVEAAAGAVADEGLPGGGKGKGKGKGKAKAKALAAPAAT